MLALAVVKAPIMHDLSATYSGSLDAAVLASGKLSDQLDDNIKLNQKFFSTCICNSSLAMDYPLVRTNLEEALGIQITSVGNC